MPINILNKNALYNLIHFKCILHLRKTYLIMLFKFNSALLPYKRNLWLTHKSQEIEVMATISKSEKNKRNIERSN